MIMPQSFNYDHFWRIVMSAIKDLSWKLKSELKAKGLEIGSNQLLDALSKALGENSHEQASARPEAVEAKIKTLRPDYPLSDKVVSITEKGSGVTDNDYQITLSASAILKRTFNVKAPDKLSAVNYAKTYVSYNNDSCRDSGDGWSFDRLGYGHNGLILSELVDSEDTYDFDKLENTSLIFDEEEYAKFYDSLDSDNPDKGKNREMTIKLYIESERKLKDFLKEHGVMPEDIPFNEDAVRESVSDKSDQEIFSLAIEIMEKVDNATPEWIKELQEAASSRA